ncbi:amidohydrolase family protein [Limobrevibacterium gyesilva]|uniref:Amidohydrolase n=1 Tax=Limobrevibacterium gyesilva TaxID=2991712 RepID=A0AA41YPK5_9PROT|nr:amidohydrolase family protein [Limobrevibacterium gyesilva]MCW3474308.1 amidohydrolase [Limobrevibacterium gyesilva]
MNVQIRETSAVATAASRLAIADCDIHPATRQPSDLHPWLERRWIEHMATFGRPARHGWQSGPAYPKSQPNASRRDAWPPEGGRQGSSLAFMQAQHLDPNNVQHGILNPLGSGQGVQNPDLSTALCSATNDWQLAEWTGKDARLKASVVVNYEDGPAAAAEIRKRAGDRNFVQVLLLTRTAEPLGARRYWPIYEAAAEAGLPVGIHAFGYGGQPITGSGWPSFYIEEMTGHAQTCQAVLTSLVTEGVFARHPKLKVILVEAGFAWAPALAWRLDKTWKRLRAETPHLTRLPSEYIRDHVWWTTQPMEEPEPREHLLDTIGWIGWDRLLFATDYPHWDFDDPTTCLPLKLSEPQRRQFFLANAQAVYGPG